MSRRFLLSCIQGVLLLPIIPVVAEEVPTVVVSATRSEQSFVATPTSIKVISQGDIKNSGASNLADVLRAQAGVQVNDLYGDGTQAGVVMRGLGSTSNVLILVDGRRLNNVDISAPDISSISLQDVERIEIIQGSAGTLFGDQAVGGVINVITKQAKKGVTAAVAAGNFGRERVQLKLCGDASEQLAFCYSEDALRADNYRDNNSVDDRNTQLRANFKHNNGRVFLERQRSVVFHEQPGSLLAAEVAQDRTQSFADFINDYSDADIEVLRTGVQQSLGNNWSFEMEITARDEDREILQSFRGFQVTTPSGFDNNQREFTPRLIGAYAVPHGTMLLTLGSDLIATDYVSDNAFAPISDEQKQRAAYAQVVYPFAPGWSLTTGARKARVSNDVVATYKNGTVRDNVTVGELGVSWQVIDAMKLFARVDRNYRFAKVDEFTYTSPGDELEAQTGKSFEAGANWHSNQLDINASVYRLKLEDEIAFDPTAAEPVGSFFGPGANVNYGKSIHQGMMLDSTYQLSEQLDVTASFAYTDATFDSGVYKNNAIPGIAPRVLTIAPVYNNGSGFSSRLELMYTDDRYVDGDSGNSLPKQNAYSLLNTSLRYDDKAWNVSLRINNLLNRTYNESENSFGSIVPANEINFWLMLGVSL